jgi:hypothetical protein
MKNYTWSDDGVFIKNLSNHAEQYGVTQYKIAANYELREKHFLATDGKETHALGFVCKKHAELDGQRLSYEALKLEDTTYFVRIGYHIAVLDLGQGLITMIFADKDDYFYGKIQCEKCDFPDTAAHVPAGDDMVGTKVAWVLGSNRYVNHEYVAEGKCDVTWSPRLDAKSHLDMKATRIKEGIYLVDIPGLIPHYACAPSTVERSIFLQDYDHMMTVGALIDHHEPPMLISGYARFIEPEEGSAQINANAPNDLYKQMAQAGGK